MDTSKLSLSSSSFTMSTSSAASSSSSSSSSAVSSSSSSSTSSSASSSPTPNGMPSQHQLQHQHQRGREREHQQHQLTQSTSPPHTSGAPLTPQPVASSFSPVAPIYHFKILVPAAAAGRIIGKGGTTIAQLQKDAGARVKMSKASEFYPGTTERVCLISGPMEGILKINDFFTENFSSGSIKILVPNSTAGMIIGKGGSYIKQIKEESGAYVQISQKCTDFSLPERCVTVVGELENIRKACSMILNKIVEDVGSAFRDIRTSSMTASIFSSSNSPNHSPLHHHQHHQSPQPSGGSTSSSLSPSSAFSLTSSINSSTFTSSSIPSGAATSISNSHNNNHNHNHNSLNNNNLNCNSISTANSSLLFGSHSASGLHNIVKSLTPDHLSAGTPVAGNTHSISPPLLVGQPAASVSPLLAATGGGHTAVTNSTGSPLSLNAATSTSGSAVSSSAATAGSSVWSDMNSAQIIETIKLVLRVSGYGEDAVSEISSAMSTLANYGVLGVGLGLL